MVFTVLRAEVREVTSTDWLTSRHSFSFGDHYDPSNTHHGLLIACNEEVLLPGHGFDAHHHSDSEIVTWVVSGTLVHTDSAGHTGVVYPGLAQRMSAGSGIDHTERNDPWPDLHESGSEPVHYIQMWLVPDEYGITPSYEQRDISAALAGGDLVAVASGDPSVDAAITISNRAATLFAVRIAPGASVGIPDARFTHVLVVDGRAVLSTTDQAAEVTLTAGDAARGVDTSGATLQTDAGDGPAEILIWAMDKALGEP